MVAEYNYSLWLKHQKEIIMADLLIRGVEMPKGCYFDEPPYRCLFCDGLKCVILKTVCPSYERLPNCPLIELSTHGELIDHDKLLVLMSNEIVRRGGDERAIGIAWAQSAVEFAPTVIEANEVEQDD